MPVDHAWPFESTVETRHIGRHISRNYVQLYDSNFMKEHTYYNSCYCNEYSALMGRHLLHPLPVSKTWNTAYARLEDFYRIVADSMRSDALAMSEPEVVFSQTRPDKVKRYIKAYNNILSRRLTPDERSSHISAFVKYEKWDMEKVLAGKPPRMIQFRSYEYLYTLKAWMLDHCNQMKVTSAALPSGQLLRTCFTKNFTNEESCALMKAAWDSYTNPVALCLDHSKFDGHYGVKLLELEHKFWHWRYGSKQLDALLKRQLDNKGWTQGGIKYTVRGTRASGEFTTSEGNGISNLGMLTAFMNEHGFKAFHVFVNGDDSVVIGEDEISVVADNLGYFNNFGMETEMDVAAKEFCDINYCQQKPVQVGGVWRFVKEWQRSIARSALMEYRYYGAPQRYLAGTALCDLACFAGVPILQAWAIRRLRDSGFIRPLGCVDKSLAREFGHASYHEISMATRWSFEAAFGVSPHEQVNIERSIAGGPQNDPQVLKYLYRYRNFAAN